MDTGGLETNLVGLARELSLRGHQVLVVSSGGNLVSELEAAGAEHLCLPLRVRNPVGLIRASLVLRRLLRRESVAIAHSMSAAGSVALALATRHSGCRFVASPMGLQNSDRESRLVTDVRNVLLTYRMDRALAISEEIERGLRRVRVDPERIIRCDVVGIDPAAFGGAPGDRRRIRDEFGVPVEGVVISTIGALHVRKRHDLFLRACRDVAAVEPGAYFLVVGDGPERVNLQGVAVDMGIASRVRFTGRRRDIGAVLAATDVYVKPGVVEGFIGITVLEAMAANVPVVAFDTRDVRAAIVPGQTGLVVPARDVAALGSAICRLLQDPVLADALSAHARELVLTRFDRRTVAANLEQVYLSLVSEPSAA